MIQVLTPTEAEMTALPVRCYCGRELKWQHDDAAQHVFARCEGRRIAVAWDRLRVATVHGRYALRVQILKEVRDAAGHM